MALSVSASKKVYEQGYRAGLKGRSADDNPYIDGDLWSAVKLITLTIAFDDPDDDERAELWEQGRQDGEEARFI